MVKNFPDLKTPYRRISLDDIMNCMFGLKSFETKTYFELVDKGVLTVNELVEKFDMDRSTVQRALQNLAVAGLIYREQRNIKHGGYYYVYHAAPFDEVKETMKSSLKKWSEAVTEWIDNLTPE